MSIKEKREKMLSLVAEWKSSGLTQQSFCLLHDIKVATLQYWVARSREQTGSDVGFTEISPRAAENGQIEIIYPTGVRLKVSGDVSLISQLIRL